MKDRIYLDCSVYGGYYDKEFEEQTLPLFKSIMKGDYRVLVSDTLTTEISQAPNRVQKVLADIPGFYKEDVQSNNKVRELAREYVKKNIISLKHWNDTMHIATATVFQSRVLVSWNFKHIVNFERIGLYNDVNIKQGYMPIQILTPLSFTN